MALSHSGTKLMQRQALRLCMDRCLGAGKLPCSLSQLHSVLPLQAPSQAHCPLANILRHFCPSQLLSFSMIFWLQLHNTVFSPSKLYFPVCFLFLSFHSFLPYFSFHFSFSLPPLAGAYAAAGPNISTTTRHLLTTAPLTTQIQQIPMCT